MQTGEKALTNNISDNRARLMVKILAFIGQLFWEASERADTRCWTLLPDTIQAARVDLPEGKHSIKIRAHKNGGGDFGSVQVNDISVAKGRNTYIFVFYPSPGAKPAVIAGSFPL